MAVRRATKKAAKTKPDMAELKTDVPMMEPMGRPKWHEAQGLEGEEKLDPQEEKILDWILKGVVIFILGWLALSILLVIGGYFGLWK